MLKKWLNNEEEYFFTEVWNQKELLYTSELIQDFPFNLEKLEYILNYYPLSYENLKLFNDNGVVPIQMYTKSVPNHLNPIIDKEKLLASNFLQNKTIVLNQIHLLDLELLAFNQKLEEAFGCTVNMNLYYSNGNISGVNAHYDQHHIFAVQLSGKKKWSIGDVVVENPSRHYRPYIDEKPFNKTIETTHGDILYIAPGQWHTVETIESSLHIAIGVHPPTWEKYIQTALEQAANKHTILRGNLPFYIEKNRCVYKEDVSYEIERLLQLLLTEKVGNKKNTYPSMKISTEKK